MWKKSVIPAIAGILLLNTSQIPSVAQSLQEFSQQDFENLIKQNPALLKQILNPDGSVNRFSLEKILRDRFGYKDNFELPAYLDFEGAKKRMQPNTRPLDIEHDVRLQKRLEEEREKAYEAYKKRVGSNPPK